MPRIDRHDAPGAAHHLMNRGGRHAAIFLSDEDRRRFVEGLSHVVELGLLVVHAFALMTNHFHLVAGSRHGTISEAMHRLGRVFKGFNMAHGFDGQVCRGRFRSVPIRGHRHFATAVHYVHENPVRAGLAPRQDLARWSSFAPLAGTAPMPAWLSNDASELVRSGPEELLLHKPLLPGERLFRDYALNGDLVLPERLQDRRGKRITDLFLAHELATTWALAEGLSLPDVAGRDLRPSEREHRDGLLRHLADQGVKQSIMAEVLELPARTISHALNRRA